MEEQRRPADAFKALAHDLRLRLYYAVGAAGECTATMLAQSMGLSASAVSYHLTKLGEFGLLEQVQDPRRDGRERWWKLQAGGLQVGDDAGKEADALRFAVLRHHQGRLQDFLSTHSAAEPSDNALAFSSDMVIPLTEETAEEFQAEFADLLRRYAREASDGVATLVMLQAIPFKS